MALIVIMPPCNIHAVAEGHIKTVRVNKLNNRCLSGLHIAVFDKHFKDKCQKLATFDPSCS